MCCHDFSTRRPAFRASLLDWDLMDRLYNEEYSPEIIEYWRFTEPSLTEIADAYKAKLQELIDSSDESFEANDVIALRHEQVGNLLLDAGKLTDAKLTFETAMRYEKEKLGSRPERMAALLECQAMIPAETEDEERRRIEQRRQAIDIRKTLTGRRNKWKLGGSYTALAFNVGQWAKKYGSEWLPKEQAELEAQTLVKHGIEVFEELNDLEQLARAILVDADIMDPGPLQIERYKEAEAVCARVPGEKCAQISFIYNNIGISYYRQGLFELAYDFFRKCYFTRVEVFGPSHHMTKASNDVLHLHRYKEIAEARGDTIPNYEIASENAGVSYYREGLLDLTYEYYRKCYLKTVEEFGPLHLRAYQSCKILHLPVYKKLAEARGDTIPDYSFGDTSDSDTDSDSDWD